MEKQVLTQFLGGEKAEEVLKITKAYDNYILKFKKKINKLLEPIDYEVLTGVTYRKIDKTSKD
jgi:hypothetical protein